MGLARHYELVSPFLEVSLSSLGTRVNHETRGAAARGGGRGLNGSEVTKIPLYYTDAEGPGYIRGAYMRELSLKRNFFFLLFVAR